MKYKTEFIYELNGKIYTANSSGDENCTLETVCENGRLKIYLCPNKSIKVKRFAISLKYDFSDADAVYANGYQSWTDSREYKIYEKMDGMTKLVDEFINSPLTAKFGLNRAGDEAIYKYNYKKGFFYGFSYCYARKDTQIDLFASLNERCGYTIIELDANNSWVNVVKDLEGVVYSEKSLLLDFAVISGEYECAFDKYFELMNIKPPVKRRMTGYTTWYNYYDKVTQNIVERDLDALSALEKKVDIFQIDDGYQSAIGDWLSVDKTKFPDGMKYTADKIHSKGMLAGLWLAPFAATKSSRVYKEHPDWLVRDENGKPYICGPNWGTFYALDIYNEEAREYIRNFFSVILNEWNYDMVKLDFLYAACILPNHNKSRGEIMCDAMDFLRECCGDKLILGCGVPLAPAFGKVDFCRIGADVGLAWKKTLIPHREDVSTLHAVNNSVFRRHLDSRAFMNDPDVFLLRDNNISMTFEQRETLAKINCLFGNLLFVSDNVSDYSALQLKTFYDTAFSNKAEIISAEYTAKNEITVEYKLDGKECKFTFNCKNGSLIS